MDAGHASIFFNTLFLLGYLWLVCYVDSANTDSFIWTNRDMVITFSAGNEGTDANSNGVVDNDSIGLPATAKNVLTVGTCV